MKRFDQEADRRQPAQVDLEALWDLCADEDRLLSLEELAELSFDEPEPGQRSALLHLLEDDSVFFRQRSGAFEARSRGDVDRVLESRRKEQQARDRRAQAVEWLVRGTGGSMPNGAQRHVDLLLDFAVQGTGFDKADAAQALLVDAGVASDKATPREAFNLLVRGGVVGEHDNLRLRRHRWRRTFPEAVLKEAAMLAVAPPPEDSRRDWPGDASIAVDDPSTREVDDALELLESGGEGWRIAVHIADPGRFVHPGSAVDEEARKRMTSLYLPDMVLPMLPPALAHGAASLTTGEQRPALTFVFTVRRDGTVHDLQVEPTRLTLGRRASYEDADAGVGEGSGTLFELHAAAEALRRARAAAGGVVVSSPEVSLRVDDSGGVKLTVLQTETPGRRLVSELMVATNQAIAGYCRSQRIPVLYRIQRREGEQKGPPPPPMDPDATYDPVSVAQWTSNLTRAESSIRALRHTGLGLGAYLQATSPIRRYVDLVVHRQLRAHASGAALPYDDEALEALGRRYDARNQAAKATEGTGNEYWLLRWFELNAPVEVDAVVLQEMDDRVRLELVPYVYRTTMRARRKLSVGTTVSLVARGADPRGGRLFLREP